MSSRFYTSLAAVLWADSPAPEWLSGAGRLAWQRAVAALYQLWWDTGAEGVEIVGAEGGWLAPVRHPRAHDRETVEVDAPDLQSSDKHNQTAGTIEIETLQTTASAPQWLFTSDLSAPTLAPPDRVVIPLLSRDPLLTESFIIIRTSEFAAIVARVDRPDTERPGVAYSFEPELIQRVWQGLLVRLQQVRPDCVERWHDLDRRFPLVEPSYRLLSRFSSWVMMAAQSAWARQEGAAATPPQTLLPASASSERRSPKVVITAPEDTTDTLSETDLLKAIAHEVRTPLATIQTLTRLILRRSDIPAPVRRYLEGIERECKEQSERFGLFFRATEFSPDRVHLQTTSLTELLEQKLPLWKQQVERRGSTLELKAPADVPTVVSDPATLDAVLSGVIDRVARGVPAGSHVKAEVVTAGEQVKLQFRIINPEGKSSHLCGDASPTQSLGQLLAFQPDTGALSLSIPMTQTLFRALGGYFTVRQQAQRGETLTIFLPRQPHTS
ncbi:MAG: HAMP domain-containing sensor histidine kinase [Cyanobacteria bacterium J06642_2]